MNKLVSESRKDLLRVLLKDESLSSVLLMDGEIAKTIKIMDDGSIEIGRAKNHWYNWIFNDIRKITFIDMAFKLANVMSGGNVNTNEIIFNGLNNEIIENAIRHDDFDYVIDALFATAMFGYDGKYKSRYCLNDNSTRYSGENYKKYGSGKIPFVLNSGETLGEVDVVFSQR